MDKLANLLYYSGSFTEKYPNHDIEIKANNSAANELLNTNSHNFVPFVVNQDAEHNMYIFAYNDHNYHIKTDKRTIDDNDDEKKILIYLIKHSDFHIENGVITINNIEYLSNNVIKTKNKYEYKINQKKSISIPIEQIIKHIRDKFCYLPLTTEDYYLDDDPQLFERYNDSCEVGAELDMSCIVDVNKEFRTMRDLIKNNQINYNAIKKSTKTCDKHWIVQFVIFSGLIRFIDINQVDKYFERADNLSKSEIVDERNMLLDYLNDAVVCKKIYEIAEKSDNQEDVNELLESERFAPIQKLSEFYDICRHHDKPLIKINTYDVQLVVNYFLIMTAIKYHVIDQR